ncbi:Ribosome-binding factor A [Rickettsiales endosymbiont of Paramecium tredecaurelia]|uniref:ribosome-binding factor A n=1 Tax=Candidatus Sarmatiella mevalonica TaxID=2770581 RepID=UPI0019243F2C|nr:ribosome-binding factor A [Candidatus Sarmatiella mevalonica]MBL3285135.1 Ribosome-binding factor A [Candidatus Sarmatiella mevalonica]
MKRSTNNRKEKFSSLIHQALTDALRTSTSLDARILDSNNIIITRVDVTTDLKMVYCYFFPFNTNLTHQVLLEALNNSSKAIRYFVTQQVQMRYSPEIIFRYDSNYNLGAPPIFVEN